MRKGSEYELELDIFDKVFHNSICYISGGCNCLSIFSYKGDTVIWINFQCFFNTMPLLFIAYISGNARDIINPGFFGGISF